MGKIKAITALILSLFYTVISIVIPVIITIAGATAYYDPTNYVDGKTLEIYSVFIIVPILISYIFINLAIKKLHVMNTARMFFTVILIFIGVANLILIFMVALSAKSAIHSG